MPTYVIKSNNETIKPLTITAPNAVLARRRAMEEFHGPPRSFGTVAREWGVVARSNKYAARVTEWTGRGLYVEETTKKGK